MLHTISPSSPPQAGLTLAGCHGRRTATLGVHLSFKAHRCNSYRYGDELPGQAVPHHTLQLTRQLSIRCGVTRDLGLCRNGLCKAPSRALVNLRSGGSWGFLSAIADEGRSGWVGRVRSSSELPQCETGGGVGGGADSSVPATEACGTLLQSLSIRDFALVKRQDITFTDGLNVLTGESGAGKSVVVAALGQVLGSTASEAAVRPPSRTANITARFLLAPHHAALARRILQEARLPARALPSVEASQVELVIRREITLTKGGRVKSRCNINGAATTLRVLRLLSEVLVDVNGQGVSASLRDPDTQLALLDDIAGTNALAARFTSSLARYHILCARKRRLEELSDDVTREELQQMVDEVAASGVYDGEEKVLRDEVAVMKQRRMSVERCGLVSAAIYGQGEGGLMAAVAQLQQHLRENQRQEVETREGEDGGGGDDGGGGGGGERNEGLLLMEAAMEEVREAEERLARVEALVTRYADRFEFSEGEFERMVERAGAVGALLRKYGFRSSGALLKAADDASQRLEEWHSELGGGFGASGELVGVLEELREVGVQLGRGRRAAAARLTVAVSECLAEVRMEDSRFEVRVRWEVAMGSSSSAVGASWDGGAVIEVGEAEAGEMGVEGCVAYRVNGSGLDRVEFMMAAGPQEPLQPLSSVASGGETARVMLALKAAPSMLMNAPTSDMPSPEEGKSSGDEILPGGGCPVLILDELDTGLGSRLGGRVGQLLRRMGRRSGGSSPCSQVLCVSHLPQVAACARHHLRVVKRVDAEGRITTEVHSLWDEKERVGELVAMLGLDNGDGTLARSLLASPQDDTSEPLPLTRHREGALLPLDRENLAEGYDNAKEA